MTWRRLHNLTRRLPVGSQLGNEHGDVTWPRTDQLLNLILYTLRAAYWSGKGPEPEPIPMGPPAEPAAPKVSDTAKAALARWRNGDLGPKTPTRTGR